MAGLVFNDKTGKGYEYYSYYRDRYYGKYGGAYGYGYYAAGYYEEPSPPARRPSWLTRIFKR